LYSLAQVEIAVTVFIQSGQFDRAQKMIACADSSIRPNLHCSLAAVFAAKCEYEKALHEYKAALAIQPAHSKAIADSKAIYTSQAVKHLQQKEWRSALHYVNEALALNSTDPDLVNLAATIDIACALEGSNDQDPGQMANAIEKAFHANPTNLALVHKLALLYHQQAIELEENADTPEQLKAVWDKAIAYWAWVLEADSYWEQWFLARESYYGQTVSLEVREELRRSKVKERIRQIHRNFINEYVKTEKSNDVERHRGLMAQWSLEFNSASAVRQILEWLQRHGSPAPLPGACGIKAWELINRTAEAEQAAQQVLKTDRENEAAIQILESFTPIAMARMLRKEGLLHDAVNLLDDYIAENRRKKLAAQQAEMNRRARGMLAEMLIELGKTLVESELKQAIACWHQAVQAGAGADQVNQIIAQAVYDQASRLADQSENKKALGLLEVGISAFHKSWQIENPGKRQSNGELVGSSIIADLYARIAILEAVDIVKKAQSAGMSVTRALRTFKEAKDVLLRADSLVGPHHPAVDKNLEALEQLISDASMGSAVNMVNEAVEAYGKQKLSFKDTLAKLDEALRILSESSKAIPGDPDIKKNISDIRKVRSQITDAEAVSLNKQGVDWANSANQNIAKGRRLNARDDIELAYQFLKMAVDLAPNNTTIRTNYDQISIMRNLMRK
jgi:tetratricopeptide (TPR) repeat protein